MEDDPNGIISMLELSTCERDKWIIAAAHYRRDGNPVAAIKVLTCMMRGDDPLSSVLCCCVPRADIHSNTNPVFRKLGVTDEDLKPAFLMISACHGDQAKRAKDPSGLNTPESTEHHQLSLQWLQKVYGASVSLKKQETTNASDFAKLIPLAENKPSLKVDSSRNRDEILALPPHPSFLPAPQVSLPTSPHSSYTNRIRTLEHQVDILRERNSRSERLVAESEALKRKHEQELSHEKWKRRKVQTELDDISAKLKATRRMEKYATDIAERETKLRREAEMREKELMGRIEVLKKRATDGGKAVLFEDPTTIFQKAAQAEGVGSDGLLKLALEPGETSSFSGPSFSGGDTASAGF